MSGELERATSSAGAGALARERYDPRSARPFIEKSVSEATRRNYAVALREFFTFVRMTHPREITPQQVISFRDHLKTNRRKSSTIVFKLAVLRSYFEYLKAAGAIPLNPASSRLVSPPELPSAPAGRALTKKEVRHLLSGPNRETAEGARDYAIMLVMLRLSLRVGEVCALKKSSVSWSHGRWTLRIKVKGGREEVWPLPADVKAAVDNYLKLDRRRRQSPPFHSDGDDAPMFQPLSNFRTLEYNRSLSTRMVQNIVAKWGSFTGVGKVTPHDLRRTVITEMLKVHSYQEVQMVSKHRDPKTLMRYDHARQNLDASPVNTFNYEE